MWKMTQIKDISVAKSLGIYVYIYIYIPVYLFIFLLN